MAGSGVRSRYSLAINGRGFILKGAPGSPSYTKEDAPTQINQLGLGDIEYNQLTGSGWRYWAQTDWSGGFQQLKHKDNGTFKDGRSVNVLSEYGNISLQNAFVSAQTSHKISGGVKFSCYGIARDPYQGRMLIGTIKNSGAPLSKLYKLSANVTSNEIVLISAATVSAWTIIEPFKDQMLVGANRGIGNGGTAVKTLSKYNIRTSVLSAFRSVADAVLAAQQIGERAYIGEYVRATSSHVLSYATNLSAFTSAFNAGRSYINKITHLNGIPYFFVDDQASVIMYTYDETNEKAYPIHTWDNLVNWGVQSYLSTLVITGTSNGLRVAFAFNGAQVKQIFNDQLKDATYDFSKPFVHQDNLHVNGAQYDGFAWFPGLYGKKSAIQYTPFASYKGYAFGYAYISAASSANTQLVIARSKSTQYETSGYVIGSNFGAAIGGVDKLVNAVTVNCKPLATSQSMTVQRSINEGVSYQTVGSLDFATDGAIASKTLYLSATLVTKNWLYKVQLNGPGTTTPTLQDIAWQYRPVPDMKRRWGFTVNAGDKVKLLNNQDEQRKGNEIMAEMWLEKQAKQVVTFEDVDAFSAKIISAMTSAATSARVENTRLFPRKGRIRVKKNGVIEEMIYTSASGGSVKGITRAQLGTKAREYTSADVLDNYYSVVVNSITEQINTTDDKKTESIARFVLLEV